MLPLFSNKNWQNDGKIFNWCRIKYIFKVYSKSEKSFFPLFADFNVCPKQNKFSKQNKSERGIQSSSCKNQYIKIYLTFGLIYKHFQNKQSIYWEKNKIVIRRSSINFQKLENKTAHGYFTKGPHAKNQLPRLKTLACRPWEIQDKLGMGKFLLFLALNWPWEYNLSCINLKFYQYFDNLCS